MHRCSLIFGGMLAISGVLTADQNAQAQEPEIAYACYVPDVGAVYRVNEPGTTSPLPDLPGECFEGDVLFSWMLGEEPPTGLPTSCGDGQIAAYQAGAWSCSAANAHTHDPGDVSGGVLYDLSILEKESYLQPAMAQHSLTVDCGEGKVAISGGWYTPGTPPDKVRVTRSEPSYPPGRYWYFHVVNDDNHTVIFKEYAVCARIGGAS